MATVRNIRGRIKLSWLLMGGLFLVVALMVLYPVAMVFYGSIQDSSPGVQGALSLKGYREVYANPETYRVLWNTLWLATLRTAIAVSIAILMAWFIARTNIPHKKVLEVGLMFTFFMPLLPQIMAWILLLGPRTGFLNVLLGNILPGGPPGLNIFSYGGIIHVGVLAWVPVLYMFMVPAFKAMNASLEESAKTSGASLFTTILHVNLPLLAPAILATTALGFVRMMESFTVEMMLGIRAGIYVFSTDIFRYVSYGNVPNYPAAMALAATLLLITLGLVALQWRLLGRKQYTTVTGKGFHARLVDLGRYRWVAFAFVAAFITISAILPLVILVWASFMKIAGAFMPDMYSFKHYVRALGDPRLWTALKNTLYMATMAATIGMGLCTLVSYVVVKTKFSGRRILDLVTWVPWAVPSIVLALGFLWAYVMLPLPFRIYGTIFLMVLVLITKGFPVGSRTMTSTIIQISDELEEAAHIHGASWLKTFRHILLPLLSPAFLAGWILLFTYAVKDLETVILLYSTKSTVISVEMYVWWSSGALEEAIIIGILEAVIIMLCFVAAQLIGRRVGGRWVA